MTGIEEVVAVVKVIAGNLVDNPDSLIFEVNDSGDNVSILIRPGTNHAGQLIGKEGRIANAVRTLAKAIGAKNKLSSVFVEVHG